MRFHFTPEQESFREEVRSFLIEQLPAGWEERLGGGVPGDSDAVWEFSRRFTRRLAERKWLAMAWPAEFGGLSADHMTQLIYNDEMAYHRAPGGGGMGVAWVGPAVMLYGTQEQKDRYLPRITSGEDVWCTLYSEPGAGSDLAALQTRAVADGDDFVINGQKIWTSGAHRSNWGWLAARTDPDAPKHRGISYLLVDMKSPGVTVQPLTTMAGAQSFNQVFFENVRVPVRNRLGEENRGWYIGTTTLDFERSSIGNAVGIRKALEGYLRYAAAKPSHVRFAERPSLRREFAERWIEATVAKLLSYRVVTLQARGEIPNYESSMTKLYASELGQRIAALGMRLFGLNAQIIDRGSRHARLGGRVGVGYVAAVSSTIAGGTSEIQRNIIAQRGLGLPRD